MSNKYPNLPSDVGVYHCTAASPMPPDFLERAAELRQLWIHDDAEETSESIELDSSLCCFYCPNCKLNFTVQLAD